MKVQEGELSFYFGEKQLVDKLDEQGHDSPVGMRLVDFVIEEDKRILIVEVKDLPASQIPTNLKEFKKKEKLTKFQFGSLIRKELVPKARDSYCYLHLMEGDAKPFDFVFLTRIDRMGVNKELLIKFNDRLKAHLRKEADKKWKRPYVRNCAVLTVDTWNSHFKSYRVERV